MASPFYHIKEHFYYARTKAKRKAAIIGGFSLFRNLPLEYLLDNNYLLEYPGSLQGFEPAGTLAVAVLERTAEPVVPLVAGIPGLAAGTLAEPELAAKLVAVEQLLVPVLLVPDTLAAAAFALLPCDFGDPSHLRSGTA